MSDSIYYGPEDMDRVPPAVKNEKKNGCQGVRFYPNGFEMTEECGCCDSQTRPGWYASRTVISNVIDAIPGKFICEIDGTPAKQPMWWL